MLKFWYGNKVEMNGSPAKEAGFTLLELAVVIIILGIFTAAMAHMFKVETLVSGYLMNQRTDRIQEGIAEFYRVRGFYPCPSDPRLQEGDTNFGEGDYNPASGICDGLNLTVTAGVGGENVLIGTVPFKDINETLGCGDGQFDGWADNTQETIQNFLNDASQVLKETGANENTSVSLPDRYKCLNSNHTVDVYGSKFTYAVTQNSTALDTITAGLAPVPENFEEIADALDSGAITVVDENGFDATAEPVHYVLVSHGRDRKGGYAKNGTRIPCTGASALDFENCDDDAEFRSMPFTDLASADANGHYDDRTEFSLYGYIREDQTWQYAPASGTVNNLIFNANARLAIGVRQNAFDPEDRVRVGEDIRAGDDIRANNNVNASQDVRANQDVRAGQSVIAPKFCYNNSSNPACP